MSGLLTSGVPTIYTFFSLLHGQILADPDLNTNTLSRRRQHPPSSSRHPMYITTPGYYCSAVFESPEQVPLPVVEFRRCFRNQREE